MVHETFLYNIQKRIKERKDSCRLTGRQGEATKLPSRDLSRILH